MRQFLAPKIVFGDDAISLLRSKCSDRRVFLVTDSKLPLPLTSLVLDELENSEVEIFDEVESEPDVELAIKCAKLARSFSPDLILALGGGSVIDTAKYARIGMEVDITPENVRLKTDLESMGFKKRAELIAIPTTSGSGADATVAAMFVKEGRKISAVNPNIMPDVSILDYRLVEKLPKHLISSTGMDALSHGIEAYLNVLSNDFSEAVSFKAVEIILENLQNSYEGDLKARARIHHAATLAGLAINSTQVGAIHALAHAFGATFEINHGVCVSLFTPYVLQFYLKDKSASLRVRNLAKKLGLEAEELLDRIVRLIKNLKMPLKASEVVKDREFSEKFEILVERAASDLSLRFSPRVPSKDELREILIKAFNGEVSNSRVEQFET